MFCDDVDGHIEENNGIKYLVFTPTEKNKEALKNYKRLWEETKRQIEIMMMNQVNIEKTDWIRQWLALGSNIWYSWYDNCCCICSWKKGKYYPRIFLHECAYKL